MKLTRSCLILLVKIAICAMVIRITAQTFKKERERKKETIELNAVTYILIFLCYNAMPHENCFKLHRHVHFNDFIFLINIFNIGKISQVEMNILVTHNYRSIIKSQFD